MKSLRIIALLNAFAIINTITADTAKPISKFSTVKERIIDWKDWSVSAWSQVFKASKQIGKFRLIKEYFAGCRDLARGTFYEMFPNARLSINSNYVRGFENPTWWNKAIVYRTAQAARNYQLIPDDYMQTVLLNLNSTKKVFVSAAESSNSVILDQILKKEASLVDMPFTQTAQTALYQAIKSRNVPAVEVLLRHNADINKQMNLIDKPTMANTPLEATQRMVKESKRTLTELQTKIDAAPEAMGNEQLRVQYAESKARLEKEKAILTLLTK